MNTGFEQMKRAAFAAAVFVVAGVFAGNTLNVPSDYSTLETALAVAQDGDEIVLAADTYTTAALITVSDGITIRGATGNPEDVVIKASGSHRMFALDHADAKLSCITISGGTLGGKEYGGGVMITEAGGTVERCVICNCLCDGTQGTGAGVYIEPNSPGLVDACVIRNCDCRANWDSFKGGLAITLDGGEARSCLIVGNSSATLFGSACGAVLVRGGRLVNCTVTGNSTMKCPGVVAESGTVENCLIAENESPVSTDAKTITWSGNASCFTNCVGTHAMNGTCTAMEHPFVNSAAGDFAPLLGTAAVDTGAVEDWMADAKDVLGNARVSGDAPDIGAIEYNQSRLSACVATDVTFGKAPLDVTFTVTAAGATGAVTCFWDWNGDGEVDETSNGTVTHRFVDSGIYNVLLSVKDESAAPEFLVPQVMRISVLGDKIRVVKDNPNAAPPYDTWANAAPSIETAVDVAETGYEIVVSNGTYTTAAEIFINKGVTIRGLTGDPEDVTIKASGRHRMFALAHADAKLSGLTISGGTMGARENGGGVRITVEGGTVERCVVRDCFCDGTSCTGAGIYIEADSPGLVDSCVIRNCDCGTNWDSFRGGLAITLDGGEARNCLIVENSSATLFGSDCGAVLVRGGRLVNCTVTGNSNKKCPGVVAESGTVADCLIAENKCTTSENLKSATWSGTAKCFTNCVGTAAMNDWCREEAHPFVNSAAGDYTPALGTAAVDSGVRKDWMVEGAKDLLGNDRVSGGAPDVGAIEYEQSQFGASFGANVTFGKAPLEVVFTVTSIGATDGITCSWDWDGDGTMDEETDGSTTHTFMTPTYSGVRLSVKNNATDAIIDVPQEVFITACGDEIRVVKDNPNAAPPYDNWANAAPTLETAYAIAEGGCEIVISNGIHTLLAEIAVNKNVTIRGVTGDPGDVIIKASGNHRMFTLNNAGAKLAGLTIAGGTITAANDNGGGVKIASEGGTVERCVVCGCQTASSGGCGIGIHIAAGSPALVDSCVISNCVNVANYESFRGGLALTLEGGEARNCLITGNSSDANFDLTDRYYGSAYVKGGRLVNCTVTGNTCKKCPGVLAESGTVRNCIISGNTSKSAGADAKMATWAGAESCFDHCIGSVKINDSCFAGEDFFMDAANGDYRLAKDSAALDKGVKEPWMADPDGKDFFGGRRVSNLIPDLGYHELQVRGFCIFVR